MTINELYFVEKVFNNHWYSMEGKLFVLNLGHLIDVATGVKGKSTKCPRSGIVWNCVVCYLIDFIQSHERQSNLNLKSFFCSFCTPSLCHLRIAEHKHQCEKARQRSVQGWIKIQMNLIRKQLDQHLTLSQLWSSSPAMISISASAFSKGIAVSWVTSWGPVQNYSMVVWHDRVVQDGIIQLKDHLHGSKAI